LEQKKLYVDTSGIQFSMVQRATCTRFIPLKTSGLLLLLPF